MIAADAQTLEKRSLELPAEPLIAPADRVEFASRTDPVALV